VETGLSVYVSQRQDSEPTASVLEEQSARFWRDGYAFFVNVDGYSVQPLAEGTMPPTWPATCSRALTPGW
jgi:hypothetical protein